MFVVNSKDDVSKIKVIYIKNDGDAPDLAVLFQHCKDFDDITPRAQVLF